MISLLSVIGLLSIVNRHDSHQLVLNSSARMSQEFLNKSQDRISIHDSDENDDGDKSDSSFEVSDSGDDSSSVRSIQPSPGEGDNRQNVNPESAHSTPEPDRDQNDNGGGLGGILRPAESQDTSPLFMSAHNTTPQSNRSHTSVPVHPLVDSTLPAHPPAPHPADKPIICTTYRGPPSLHRRTGLRNTDRPRALIGWTHQSDDPAFLNYGRLFAAVTEKNIALQCFDQPFNRHRDRQVGQPCGVAHFAMIKMFHPDWCRFPSGIVRIPENGVPKDKGHCRQVYQKILESRGHEVGYYGDEGDAAAAAALNGQLTNVHVRVQMGASANQLPTRTEGSISLSATTMARPEPRTNVLPWTRTDESSSTMNAPQEGGSGSAMSEGRQVRDYFQPPGFPGGTDNVLSSDGPISSEAYPSQGMKSSPRRRPGRPKRVGSNIALPTLVSDTTQRAPKRHRTTGTIHRDGDNRWLEDLDIANLGSNDDLNARSSPEGKLMGNYGENASYMADSSLQRTPFSQAAYSAANDEDLPSLGSEDLEDVDMDITLTNHNGYNEDEDPIPSNNWNVDNSTATNGEEDQTGTGRYSNETEGYEKNLTGSTMHGGEDRSEREERENLQTETSASEGAANFQEELGLNISSGLRNTGRESPVEVTGHQEESQEEGREDNTQEARRQLKLESPERPATLDVSQETVHESNVAESQDASQDPASHESSRSGERPDNSDAGQGPQEVGIRANATSPNAIVTPRSTSHAADSQLPRPGRLELAGTDNRSRDIADRRHRETSRVSIKSEFLDLIDMRTLAWTGSIGDPIMTDQ